MSGTEDSEHSQHTSMAGVDELTRLDLEESMCLAFLNPSFKNYFVAIECKYNPVWNVCLVLQKKFFRQICEIYIQNMSDDVECQQFLNCLFKYGSKFFLDEGNTCVVASTI